MKVKIGNKWYDSSNQPICIQVSQKEQEIIASIDRENAPKGKFACFPDKPILSKSEMVSWMEG